jgi:hypothetical protein
VNDGLSLAALEAELAGLDEDDLAEIDAAIADELEQPFIPTPGPQTEALNSLADVLLYGGQAGGGKSALLIGAAAREHSDALICRREAVQLDGLWKFATQVCGPRGWSANKVEHSYTASSGRMLRLVGLNQPDDWRKHAGNGRDFYGFDEAGEFLEEQVASLCGWLRTTVEGQRCRVILASNPPRGGDGLWMLKWFAPWIDPLYPNPALPAELRWAIHRTIGSEIEVEWVDGPGEYERDGEEYTAKSYTFVPASTEDNPYINKGYRAELQSLPEPLRSQLLYGDWQAGRKDDDWQVIPTAWVKLAQERWRQAPNVRRPMLAISCDIAMGGADNLVTGSLHPLGRTSDEGWYVSPLDVARGVDITSPIQIVQNIMRLRKDGADVSVDYTGGWGTGVKSHLEQDHQTPCHGFVYSAESGARTADGKLGFANLRAELWWKLREALDPEGGTSEKLALPDDPRLTAELTTPRWHLRRTEIVIESKDEIRKRIRASTDRADVVAMLWARRHSVVIKAVKSRAQGRNAYGDWLEAAPDDNVLDW